MTPRSAMIRDRLVAHFRDALNIYCSEVAGEQWLALPFSTEFRFGWIPPIDLDAVGVDPNLIAIISPDMIGAVTAHLDDADLDTYLTIIELTADGFVARQGDPLEAIQRDLDDTLYSSAPDAMRLRYEVEARAIDKGLIPLCH